MKKLYLLCAAALLFLSTFSQTYHNLSSSSFVVNWSDISLISGNDDWSGYASVRGFRGDGLTNTTAVNPQTVLAADDPGVIDINPNITNPNTFSTGGLAEFHITDPVVAFQGSGTARAPYLKFYLNSTNRSDIVVSYNLRDIDGSTDNAIQPVALQFRINNSGNWTNVPAAFVADASTGPSLSTLVTPVSVTLPAAANNQAMLEIRIITTDAAGADELIGVDDINISSSVIGITATPSATTNMTESGTDGVFTINFSAPVPSGGTTLTYTLSGSATIVSDYNDPQSGSLVVAAGATSATITLTEVDDSNMEPTETITLTLTGSSNPGVSITATPATISLTDNEATQIAYHDFNTCTSTLSDGYTQWSVSGAQVWGCTTFGRISNGVQMNGFSSGNQLNEDWIISPSLDLSATTVPLLAFYSRTTFAGDQLNLYVSTNYVSGDPNAPGVTWTEIDGRFPNEFSDAWTLSQMINLSAFKATNVHFAFKYNSTTSAASRVTLDDIYLLNASAVPPPMLTTNSTLQDFRYVNSGGTSAIKTFTFWANDLTTDLTITAPAGFVISKDGSTFGSSVTFTPGETTNQLKTLHVRFAPTSANTSYGGYLDFNTTGFNHDRVFVKGNSYDPATTLNIVNWNIEWFGATGQGPTNEAQQSANAEIVMEYLNADAYALSEIVSETALDNLVNNIGTPGSYDYVLADWCSGGSTAAACATNQKTAFVYNTSVFSNVQMRALLRSSTNPQNQDNWANGRYPMLVSATVTKNGESRSMFFIVLHAEAGDTQSDYESRLRGINELKDTLDASFYYSNLVILGDFNDDLDISIYDANGPTVSSYTDLISDSTDSDSYESITLPLSHFGLHSHYANGDMIDHVVISNEVAPGYVDLSATLYNDIGTLTAIVNYETTTSDHYPVMTQYSMASVLPVKLVSFSAVKENNTVLVKWKTAQEINSKEFVIERSKDGVHFTDIGTVQAAGFAAGPRNYQFKDLAPLQGNNYYRLRSVDQDASFSRSSIVRVRFGSGILISLRPNPATDHVNIFTEQAAGLSRITLTDMHGRRLVTTTTNLQVNQPYRLDLKVPKGVYIIQVENDAETFVEKIIIR